MTRADAPPLLYNLNESVATLRLNRPDRLNALSLDLFEHFTAALDRALAEGARALIVTGEGRAFCSGADLGMFGASPDEVSHRFETIYNPFFRKVAELPIPIVTAVNGPAVGAGCSLALLGDVVLVARSAWLHASFVNIGLHPDTGATWLIRHLAGPQRATRMLMLAEKVDAGRAVEWGLAHSCVDDGELEANADVLARRLAAGPTVTLGLIRSSLRAAAHCGFAEMLELEARQQATAMATEDCREGVAAVKEKRPPRFSGQ